MPAPGRWTLARLANDSPRYTGLAVLLAAGAVRVQWRDDIRDLEVPAPELYAEDARIREAFGQARDRTVYLVHGRTLTEARAALARLEGWAAGRAALGHAGAVVPTAEAVAAARRWGRERPEFERELAAALEAEGFEAAAFAPFFAAYRAYRETGSGEDPEAAVRRLAAALRGPVGLLLHAGRAGTEEKSWLVAVADRKIDDLPPAEIPAVAASQLRSLNRLFAGYRQSALRLSAAGLALVGLGVLLTYGWRDGLRIFALPAGACLTVFGAFGWAGVPLNLFHLIGAFLGVCMTHNYAIFSAESAFRAEATPVSVRLSALTTGASFGVLATSAIPAVAALGLTVAAMVAAALAAIELEHLRPLRKGTAA